MTDTQTVRVQVVFTVNATDTLPAFTDALYYSTEEYAALTPEELEAAKQQRYDNWVAVVTPQPDESADTPPDA